MPDLSSETPIASFEAATPFGPVRLLLRPTDATIRHAVDAALCLDRNEPLLAALDDWLGTGLDWRWAPVPMTPEGAMARWRDQCLLDLPWALLENLPPPSQALASELEWAPTSYRLEIARLGLTEDEIGTLEPGGAVLIAPSFERPWRGVLHRPEGLKPVPVDLEPGPPLTLGRVAPDAPVSPPPPAHVLASIQLDMAGLPIPFVMGWTTRVPIDEARASLWLDDRGRIARGTLVPWANGHALLIETVTAG